MEEARALLSDGQTGAGVDRLRRLARAGHAEAALQLAVLHALGAWVEKDWPTVWRLLSLAAENGSEEAAMQFEILTAEGEPDRLPPRRVLCDTPRVRQMDGFLTPVACAWLIERARERLVPATTIEAGKDAYSESRTNSAFAFAMLDMDCVSALARHRAAAALQVPAAAIELPQIFQYKPGQEFRPHVDYFPPGGRSQRIATVLVYLNDEFADGETWFQRPDLKVRAGVGGAVYFANVDASGTPDPLSLHAGLSPTVGEKWLLSQWVHDRPYRV